MRGWENLMQDEYQMARIQELVIKVNHLIHDVELDLRRQSDMPPELARDANGRFILLDAYAALLSGHLALLGAGVR